MYVDTLCGLGFCDITTADWEPLCAFSFSSLQLVEIETTFSASCLRHADVINSAELLPDEQKENSLSVAVAADSLDKTVALTQL